MNPEPFDVAVIGAGAWGTTLAKLLAEKSYSVSLWAYEPELAQAMAERRENLFYLPGVPLPEAIRPTSSLEGAAEGADLVILATPSHAFRSVSQGLAPSLSPQVILVSATKGLEAGTSMTMSQILKDVLPGHFHRRISVLSGPSFAKEVCHRSLTAVVVASGEVDLAASVQKALSAPYFRVYLSLDVLGVEFGGAIKNVIAIAAGVVDGLGLGHNARAALITRGLAEMSRLGVAFGAKAQTFAGLAGMGDLFLTCTGDLSRNRRLGMELARGQRLEEVLASTREVAEGVNAARSVLELARRRGIEMPICEQVHAVLFNGKSSAQAAQELMARELRFEEG